MDALAFIEKNGRTRRQPYYVLSGDEDFLKRRVLAILQTLILGDADMAFSLTMFDGPEAEFSAVRNELDSVSLFGDRRLVIVDRADEFVSNFRPQLEAYITAPAASGVLVLDVKTFSATTNLAKAVPEASHIVCKPPAEYKLPAWCSSWCASQYGKTLPTPAAQMLVMLVGTTMGVLDQELQKLKDYVGERPTISAADIDEMVGRSRGANVFKILEAIGDGKPALALKILAELFEGGDESLKILGAVGYQLRKLGTVSRLYQHGASVDEAMDKAGIPKYPMARDAMRKQLKHLGRGRLDKLFDWLLELDQGMKGGNPLPDRVQMERLIVRLARPRG